MRAALARSEVGRPVTPAPRRTLAIESATDVPAPAAPAPRPAVLPSFALVTPVTPRRANAEAALAHLVEAEMVPAGEASFVAFADRYEKLDWNTPGAFATALPEHPELAEMLRSGSPTSMTFIHQSHLAARKLATIAEVLARKQAKK